jgi:hypothetical protein
MDVDTNRSFREQGLMNNTYTKDFPTNCSILEEQFCWAEDLLSIAKQPRIVNSPLIKKLQRLPIWTGTRSQETIVFS